MESVSAVLDAASGGEMAEALALALLDRRKVSRILHVPGVRRMMSVEESTTVVIRILKGEPLAYWSFYAHLT